MASSLCQIPDQPGGETKTLTRDGSEDEDYSASLCAVLRQRRASVRRSRKSRTRRPSSPFVDDRPRRRSSIFTTSSGDTAISMEEGQPLVVTQEQIFENIHLHKEVLGSVKQQPLGMRRKLKIVHQAKGYIKQHEGQLQERLAQSKSTRDIYARFTIFLATKWLQLKREAANTSNILIPWELRIKEIESHFGSVVASYFTFLRWLFWVNLVIAFILLVFVIIPEYLTADPRQDGERKIIMEEERQNASNLLTLWEFEGILKYSPIFYGYYSNVERPEYKMPLAYFLTGLIVYIYSFVAILRKMAENSRMSKLSEKEDECIFSWKLFTGWDFMIGNTETAQNRIASVILGFKEALLEEAEKKKKLRNWRIITLRAIVNICVVILLAVSAFAVVSVVSRSSTKARSWWRENETTIVVTVISITFPVFFELLGILEHYHPRKQLRLQLARIMLLNLLNLYSLIFALFSKIEGMSKDLDALKPTFSMNTTNFSQSTLSFDESLLQRLPLACFEVSLSCNSCNMPLIISYSDFSIKGDLNKETGLAVNFPKTSSVEKIAIPRVTDTNFAEINYLTAHNLIDQGKISKTIDTTTEYSTDQVKISKSTDTTTEDSIYPGKMSKPIETTTEDSIVLLQKEMKKHRAMFPALYSDVTDETSEYDEIDIYYDDDLKNTSTTSTFVKNDTYVNFTITDINTTTSINDAQSNDDLDSYSTTEVYESTTDDIINATLNISNNAILTSVINSEAFNGGYIADNESELTTSYSGQYYTGDIFTASVSKSYMETTYPNNMHQVERNVSETVCPKISFNCSVICGDKNVTQVFKISNCTVVEKKCYTTQCRVTHFQSNTTSIDLVYEDERRRRMYNLTKDTKRKLLKLCWETMFGQELVKLTMMDLVFVFLGTLFIDFFRSLFVRYMNRCWCWDLEKKFPEYGDFKIAENILHLINNQGMVWMGMFFSPGLVVLNVSKLMIMMYLRSWAVMTCNVPHEVVFRVSKSNNFYLALLLTMLFLCVLPVGYSIVWVKPSWHCGPFSEYDKIYYILTSNIYKILPKTLNFALEYVASPAIVIPLLVLLILIIYYLTSLTNSLREANNDLKIQLRRERTEERRKMFQLADTRRRVGSSALDNTPFARWKRALPGLPLRSMDSDERNTTTKEDMNESYEAGNKKRGGSFVKIVSMALDKKSTLLTQTQVDDLSPLTNLNDKTDMDFNQIVKIDELTMLEIKEDSKKETNPIQKEETIMKKKRSEVIEYEDKIKESSDLKANIQKQRENKSQKKVRPNPWYVTDFDDNKKNRSDSQRIKQKSASQPSGRAKHSDSLPSIVPRITISTTESDDDLLQEKEDTCPDPDPE